MANLPLPLSPSITCSSPFSFMFQHLPHIPSILQIEGFDTLGGFDTQCSYQQDSVK